MIVIFVPIPVVPPAPILIGDARLGSSKKTATGVANPRPFVDVPAPAVFNPATEIKTQPSCSASSYCEGDEASDLTVEDVQCYEDDFWQLEWDAQSIIGMLNEYQVPRCRARDRHEYYDYMIIDSFATIEGRPYSVKMFNDRMYRGVGNGVELFKGAKNKDGTICPGVYSPNVRKYYIEKIYWEKIIALLAQGFSHKQMAKDFSEYKAMCGEIKGLLTARMYIKDLQQRMENSDE